MAPKVHGCPWTGTGRVRGGHLQVGHWRGKEFEEITMVFRGENGDVLKEPSRDMWNVADKAATEAYGKIKMSPNDEVVLAYGVMCRWIT